MMAHVHNDILNFDKKYETLVGEKGVTLSGGQKQRLAIARMLILNKPVIIFDDSLSAVDTETDKAIRNSLKKMGREITTIIITHRITTAKEADKIIVLDNGRVKVQPLYSTSVSYDITISNGEYTNTITLFSVIPGQYNN